VQKHPTASEIILRDFCMDDLLTGASSVQEATKLKQEINHILNKAGFEMSKWASTSIELMKNHEKPIDVSDDQQTKTLGVVWEYNKDFPYISSQSKVQKRNRNKKINVISHCAIMGPIGFNFTNYN
jgi:ribosomal protein S8